MRLLIAALLLIVPLHAASCVDYFARVDGAGFGSTYWTVNSGSFSRGTSAVYGTSASASLATHSNCASLDTEQYGAIRIAAKSGANGNSNYRGISARVQANGDRYDLRSGDDSGNGHVVRVIGGTPTTLTPVSGSLGGLDVGDILQWTVEGTGATVTITARRYNASCAEVGSSPAIYQDTDAARITSAGAAGVVAATSSSNFRIDDFYAGDISDGIPPCRLNVSSFPNHAVYVSPTAAANGTGSLSSPITMHAALYATANVPTDATFWMLGNTSYGWDQQLHDDGDMFTFDRSGTSGSRVKFHCVPGQTCIFDPNKHCGAVDGCEIVNVTANFMELKGVTIRNSDNSRKTMTNCGSNPAGTPIRSMRIAGNNDRFVDLIIHDTGEGPGSFGTSDGGEFINLIAYNNGWDGPDRTHGHGSYFQNTGTVQKVIKYSAFFRNASFQSKIFSQSGGPGKNILLDSNVYLANKNDNGTRGAGSMSRGLDVQVGDADDQTWNKIFAWACEFNFNVDNTIADGFQLTNSFLDGALDLRQLRGATVNNNVFSHTFSTNDWAYRVLLASDASADTCPEAVTSLDGNTFYRITSTDASFTPGTTQAGFDSACSPTNNTHISTVFPAYGTSPSGSATTRTWALVHPEKPGHGRVVIFNPQNLSTVDADVSEILRVGDPYEVIDVQNIGAGPVATGTYAGGNLTFDMTLTSIQAPTGAYGADPGMVCGTGSDVSGGYGLHTVTQIVVSSNVGVATTSAAHGLVTGWYVTIAGNTTDTDLNATYLITAHTSTTLTFTTANVADNTYTDGSVTARRGGTPHGQLNWKHTEPYFYVAEVRRRQVWANSTLKWKGASTDVIRYGLRNAAGAIVWDGPPAEVSCDGSDCEAEIPQPSGDVFYQINDSVAMKARL